MAATDEEDYGDIADEDLIEAFSSQPSQTLPLLGSPRPSKRRRLREHPNSHRRGSRQSSASNVSSGEDIEEEQAKKSKYRIHISEKEVPAARILGATQADALPDSSPYRIRGPIYKKPRTEQSNPSTLFATQHPSRSSANNTSFHRTTSVQLHNNSFSHEFDDIPPDAFSSQELVPVWSSPPEASISRSRQRVVAPRQGLQQTTLFGGRAPQEVSASQSKKVHNFIVDKPPESPTHHTLNMETLKSWVYPTNLGAIREYQYSIVRHALFHNTLVALPTGLGKTFIAATIMYNFFRWTRDAQIVFVAPTKPLVAQQVDACFNIVGIPKSQTTMLTGEQAPILRAGEWEDKRVFFMTPQTLENDLSSGIADPKKIVLLVVDEAHRATGNYAYVKVVSFIRRFNKSFRVLALTATPGASVEAVQDVIDGLEISKVEIRTEDSIDIQKYVHKRNIDQIILEPSDEMIMIKDLLSKTLKPVVDLLCGQNGYWNRDPMSITNFGMVQARKQWMSSGAGRAASMPLKGMMNGLFSTLASVGHSIKLLNFHGIGPFYSAIKEFRSGGEERKAGKYRKQIIEHEDFKKMMNRVHMWINQDGFIGHPKISALCDNVLNHFLDAGEDRRGEDALASGTRVIVFAEYRDSAEDVTRVLNRHGPMIRASVFVGQADSKRSEGMNQATQIETINNFKSGKFNVLVATSIGEEGLDIGQVDLIVCYDSSSSPIRMLQRMGRTGRKRAGHIVLLLMKGKEEEGFAKSKDNYEQMQKMIGSGARFNFRHDLSVRILPREIVPEVEKRQIEIPSENTQDPSLPEPRRRRTSKLKKKPAKKFHMPDGVETGFQTASRTAVGSSILAGLGVTVKQRVRVSKNTDVTPMPSISEVLLSVTEAKELERRYQNVTGDTTQEVSMPDLTAHPLLQRTLGPAVKVKHGQYTKRSVALFKSLGDSQRSKDCGFRRHGDEVNTRKVWNVPSLIEDAPRQKKAPKNGAAPKNRTNTKKQISAANCAMTLSDIESEEERPTPTTKKRNRIRNPVTSSPQPDSEGQGDDLLTSEVPSEDNSDDGADLQDFIVATGMERSSSERLSTTPRLSGSSSSPKTTGPRTTIDLDTTDEEIVDVSDLLGTTKSSFSVIASSEEVWPARQRNQRQRFVEEEDSDE